MTLNQKSRDLLHFFQSYLFYSLIGGNLHFYKLILTHVLSEHNSYLTRIFAPIVDRKSAKTFLKRLNFEEDIEYKIMKEVKEDEPFLVVPLRKEKKFIRIDYGLIKQTYRIVIQDIYQCGIHLDLNHIPQDEELHGYIVENLLNYHKYYADCTKKVKAGDAMNAISSSQLQQQV